MGSEVWGLGFRVWGLGFRVWVLGFGVWVLGFGVWGLGFISPHNTSCYHTYTYHYTTETVVKNSLSMRRIKKERRVFDTYMGSRIIHL